MRCQQCGYANQENHKFCGMCGAKLESAATAVTIDDNDPLGIETSAPPTRLHDPAQIARQDRQREKVRDVQSINSRSIQRPSISSVDVEDLPADTAEEEAVEEVRHRAAPASRATGISGPSFLGLGEASNTGFIYDTPRDDGFVYDSPSETPEYLLTEVSRGVSWRAWGLLLLLVAAAALGYIQWRASRHEGPDISAILAGNGATVGPGGPAMTGNNAKPAAKPNPPASDAAKTDSPQSDASSSESQVATADSTKDDSTKDDGINAKSDETQSAKKEQNSTESSGASANPADTKAADGKVSAKTSDDANTNSDDEKAVAASDEDGDGSAKPQSDESPSKPAKPAAKRAAIDEEQPAKPKSLGAKDPLLIQADKYIYGRGVPQNCSTGVNLLRQGVSEGNPEASVKLGALYWAGTCVTQSRVTAYQWFSRAHSLEPSNRWIERSRNSLWASMNPSERQRVGY